MINFFLFFTWDSEISAHWLSWVWNGVGENTWLSLEVILTKGFTSKAGIDALRCDGGTTLRQEAQRLAGGIFLQNSYLLIGIWSNWTNWHKVLVWCLVHIWTCSLPLSGVRTLIWLVYGANCMSGAHCSKVISVAFEDPSARSTWCAAWCLPVPRNICGAYKLSAAACQPLSRTLIRWWFARSAAPACSFPTQHRPSYTSPTCMHIYGCTLYFFPTKL